MANTTTKSTSLAEHLLASATGHFRWPNNAVLYRLPSERELLSDVSRRLMFQAYLQLSNLEYSTKIVNNANYMSPTGTSPFLCLHIGTHPLIFSDFEKLVTFLEAQNLGLKTRLEPREKSDSEAYLSLIRTKIDTVQEYQTWANTANVKSSVKIHGFGLSWPLKVVVPKLQQFKYVWNHWDMYKRPEREMFVEFEHTCSSLSQRLGKKETFFDTGLTILDIAVYAHLKASLSSSLPSRDLSRIVLQFENLKEFVEVVLPSKGLKQSLRSSGLESNHDGHGSSSSSLQRES